MLDTEYEVMTREEWAAAHPSRAMPSAVEVKFGAYLVVNPYGQPVEVFTERKWADKDAESRSKYAREHCAICGGLWSEGGHSSCLGN